MALSTISLISAIAFSEAKLQLKRCTGLRSPASSCVISPGWRSAKSAGGYTERSQMK